MTSQSRLSKSLRSIRSLGRTRHKYTSNNNFANLSVNAVRDIKPNDIQFKHIHIERLPKNIQHTVKKLKTFKEIGLGYKSHGNFLRKKENSRSVNPIRENTNYSRKVSRPQSRMPESRNNGSRNIEHKLQKRLNNLHGHPTLEKLQKRLDALRGIPNKIPTVAEFQKRLDALHGTKSMNSLKDLEKRLKKLENNQ